jgi:hypothetical protein
MPRRTANPSSSSELRQHGRPVRVSRREVFRRTDGRALVCEASCVTLRRRVVMTSDSHQGARRFLPVGGHRRPTDFCSCDGARVSDAPPRPAPTVWTRGGVTGANCCHEGIRQPSPPLRRPSEQSGHFACGRVRRSLLPQCFVVAAAPPAPHHPSSRRRGESVRRPVGLAGPGRAGLGLPLSSLVNCSKSSSVRQKAPTKARTDTHTLLR